MTAEPPQSLVTEAVRSLEVRWIFPGQLEAAVAGWFGRFPARAESREDAYLLDPQFSGLSVKVRGGGALEVKAYRGSPGILEIPGRARGRLESWQKWSFPSQPRQRRPARLACGAQAAADQPVRAGQRAGLTRASGRAGSRGARWNSPRSSPAVRTGGPWASRRPARPICSTAHSRLPPRSYSPTPCPAARNPARITPRPTPSGSASGRMPGATSAPENCPCATSSRGFHRHRSRPPAVADHRRTVTSPSGASRSVRSSTAAGIGSLLAAALHGPQEYAYAGPQDGEVAEHLDHQHYPGHLGFRGDVPETHR